MAMSYLGQAAHVHDVTSHDLWFQAPKSPQAMRVQSRRPHNKYVRPMTMSLEKIQSPSHRGFDATNWYVRNSLSKSCSRRFLGPSADKYAAYPQDFWRATQEKLFMSKQTTQCSDNVLSRNMEDEVMCVFAEHLESWSMNPVLFRRPPTRETREPLAEDSVDVANLDRTCKSVTLTRCHKLDSRGTLPHRRRFARERDRP